MKNANDSNLVSMNEQEMYQTNGGSVAAVFIVGAAMMALGYTVGKDLGKLWAQHDKANN